MINISGLVDPTHSDRSDDTGGLADLLWFPTGGGKTEAYLGVAAFAMGIRRLQGTIGGLAGGAGVTVLMRYTLRLLTLQQFQRATALICAMEVIRREDEDKWALNLSGLDYGLGSAAHQTGHLKLRNLSNKIITFSEQVAGLAEKELLLNLLTAPGVESPSIRVKILGLRPLRLGVLVHSNIAVMNMGNAPFSHKASPDEGLPTLVVDEEIYRRLPSLLIATVDKFAQMPWKGETQMLFGRVNGVLSSTWVSFS